MNKKYARKRLNEDEEIIFKQSMPKGIVRQVAPAINLYEYSISGPIGELENYEELVNILRAASDEDAVKITICSPGGDLHTAQALVAEINRCEGFVIAAVYGECASAATMIALACDEWDIEDNSSWLVHNCTWA